MMTRPLNDEQARALAAAHPSPNGSPELLWVEVTS